MDERERERAQAALDRGAYPGQPPADDGIGNRTAPPDEGGSRRTGIATDEVAPGGDPLEPESRMPGTASPPWVVVGLVLLLVFLAILAWAVIQPLR